MYVSLGVYATCVCEPLQRPEEGDLSPGAQAADGCELPAGGAGTRTQVP